MSSPEPANDAGQRGGNGPRLTPLAPHVASRHTLRDVLIVIFRERRLIILTFSLIPVSYTHLDVYKRQVIAFKSTRFHSPLLR